jgi:hypothetical protein
MAQTSTYRGFFATSGVVLAHSLTPFFIPPIHHDRVVKLGTRNYYDCSESIPLPWESNEILG